MMLAFYLTPVFYPKEIIPADYLWLVRFNPLRSLLEVFRDPIYFGKIPPLSHLAVTVGITALALLVGVIAFRKSSDRIAFYL
jgi:ABC-type polysaccharide/polyol phosphate export permease